jgi:preprotein translocase subunit SecF
MKESQGLFKIIKRSFLWITITTLLTVGSLALFFINFRPSIEFTGGIQLSIQNLKNQESLTEDITKALQEKGLSDIQIHIEDKETINTLLVSLPFKDDAQVKEVSTIINSTLLEKKHITSEEDIVGSSLNGPSVSSYMKSSAINAIGAGLILIAIYMMFSFMSMRKHISPLTLAAVTIATAIFDLAIPSGAYALWMAINHSVTVDTTFIIAILTIMGYSMNDTIIILDRIRENSVKYKE